MDLCTTVRCTGGPALGDASQGRPAFEDLIRLCILSPKSTFQRATAALSAVSVHSRDLANGVWWNGTAHYIGDWLYINRFWLYSWLCHWFTMETWANLLLSLSFIFRTHNVKIMMLLCKLFWDLEMLSAKCILLTLIAPNWEDAV